MQVSVNFVMFAVFYELYKRAAYEGVVVVEDLRSEADPVTWHIPKVLSSLKAGRLETSVGGSDRFHYTVSIYVEGEEDNDIAYLIDLTESKPTNIGDKADGQFIVNQQGNDKYEGVFQIFAPYYASIWEVVINHDVAGEDVVVTATIRFTDGELAVQPLYDGDLPVGVKDSDKYNISLTATASGVLLTVTTTGGDVESYGDYQVELVSIVMLGTAEVEESTEQVSYVSVSAESGEVMLLVDRLPDDFQEGSRTLAIKRIAGDDESVRVVRIVLSLDLSPPASGTSAALGGEDARLHEFEAGDTYELSGTGAEGFSVLDGSLLLLGHLRGQLYFDGDGVG